MVVKIGHAHSGMGKVRLGPDVLWDGGQEGQFSESLLMDYSSPSVTEEFFPRRRVFGLSEVMSVIQTGLFQQAECRPPAWFFGPFAISVAPEPRKGS